MRALALAALLAAPLLAGCIGGSTLDQQRLAALGFDLAGIGAEGATIEALPDAARVVWDVELPVGGQALALTIPPGVTMVEATLEWPEGGPGVTMPVRESGPLRRCARFEDLLGHGWTCRGLTALDPLPATWTFDLLPVGAEGPVPVRLEAVLSGQPLDGPAAAIHVDRLSRATFDIVEDAPQYVAASDGAPLYVEVSRPDNDQPVPAILISSPYNNAVRVAGQKPFRDAPYNTIPDYVPRGYAVVVADVRGFGNSGGCVEVWGPKEQQDQYDLVEWVAAQPWSDGNVAMYGQSYVGTTPVQGAVMAPPHLRAIAAVAPVTDAYFDWHFGGVPNGESTGSPIGYQMTGSEAPPEDTDTMTLARLLAESYCGSAELLVRPNDPRAVYDEFYRERNFSARAAEVQVPVLYTQGHFDRNVKSAMANDWFSALDVPKKGFFGPWYHRHPPRPDFDLMLHAWFDQWLKGIDTGILDTPEAEVMSPQGTWRGADAWPGSAAAQPWALHLDAAAGALREAPTAASDAGYAALPLTSLEDLATMAPTWPFPEVPGASVPGEALTFELPAMEARRFLTGAASLDLTLTLQGASNTYVAAYLFEQDGDAVRPITFGWRNAALRDSYETYQPVPAGEPFALTVPMLPTEWALEPGKGLLLVVRYATPKDWAGGMPGEPGQVTVHTGEGQSVLRLPTLAASGDREVWRTARVT